MPFNLSSKIIVRSGGALLLIFLVFAGWTILDARHQLQDQTSAAADQVVAALQAAAGRDAGWTARLPRTAELARVADVRVYDGDILLAEFALRQEGVAETAPQWFARLIAGTLPVTATRMQEQGGGRVVIRFDVADVVASAWGQLGRLTVALSGAFLLGAAIVGSRTRRHPERLSYAERSPILIQDARRQQSGAEIGAASDMVVGTGADVSCSELLASQTSDAILIYDRKGLVVYCNPAAEQLLGYAPGELLGKPVMRLMPPWKRDEVQEDLATATGAPAATELETQRLTKRGALIDVALSSVPLRDPARGAIVIGRLWSMRDISRRKQEETILRLLERGVTMSPDGIIITDASRDNAVIYANPAVEAITGYSSAELLGKSPRLLYAHESNQAGIEQLKQGIRAGEACRVILHNQRKDGKGFWNELSVAPIRDSGGRVTHFIGVLRDVTERTRHEDQLVRAESRLRTLIDGAPIGICISDEHNELQAVNPFFCALLGFEPEELAGRSLHDVIPEEVWARIAPARAGAQVGGGEIWLAKKTGERLTLLANTAFLTSASGTPDVVTFLVDITGRKRAEQALFQEKERAQVTLESIGEGVITTNAKGIVDYLNPVAEKLTGWLNEEAQGMPLAYVLNILDEDTRKPLQDPVERALRLGRLVTVARQASLVREDGKEFAIQVTAAPIRDRDEKIIGAVVVFHDVTEMRAMARQMTYEARYDALTGLLNRREFEKHLKHALTIAREENKEHVLGYLDLDKFKPVNDICGHSAGDELLRQIAAIIQSKLRESDVLARLGGDEFGILLYSCSVDSARKIAESIRHALKDYRFVWGDHTFDIGVSIGLVPVTAASGSLNDVLSAADSACYTAKNEGRDRVDVYEGESETEESGKTQWMRRIKEALEHDQFCLYQQAAEPLTEAGRTTRYYEILLRLRPRAGELLPPMAFLPAAERYQLMQSIDQWVVSTVLAMLGRGEIPPQDGDVVYGINLSAQSLCEEEFIDFVLEQIDRNDVPPERICFEVRDADVMANFSHAVHFVRTFKERGCRFALDDFGCARSSFGHLGSLPVDYLKIEGAIIRRVVESPADAVLADAIGRIGHLMGVRIIATQVESRLVLDKVKELGLDYAQGYEVARPRALEPVPAADDA
ncbi:MAG: PAS domain S-box protein [Gammaproteobacteria bacterium]